MRVIYYKSPTGNFGDDLNAVLWRAILPAACFEVDDAVLLGIGSIFRDEFLSADATDSKRVFVLGSGAGTGPLPSRWPNAAWSILGVRGPLTAALIGRPDAALTDSAALIAATPALRPRTERRGEIAFMPHYNSVEHSRWPEACEQAGYTYIDAHWPVDDVLTKIGQARLLITEAMHGAIVADALRVPWVPVVCSPSILPFKWVDWARSVELDYRPVTLPPSSAYEALRHFKTRVLARAQGLNRVPDRDQEILDDFYRRFGVGGVDDPLYKPMLTAGQSRQVQRVTRLFDPIFANRAAEALTAASRQPAFLSKDDIFSERVDRLQHAVARLERELIGTRH